MVSITAAGWAAIAGAVSAGAAVYSATQTPDSPDIQRQQIAQAPQIQDKTLGQKAEKLDEASIGDEESRKRKAQATKSKFKVDLDTPSTTGVNLGASTNAIQGVQI